MRINKNTTHTRSMRIQPNNGQYYWNVGDLCELVGKLDAEEWASDAKVEFSGTGVMTITETVKS